jgi:CHAT domain-containing protein
LLVGATVIESHLAQEFHPLAGVPEELAAARQAFPVATVLEGEQATAHNISQELPHIDLFHFAGHAALLGGQFRLLVAPDPAAGDAGDIQGLWQPDKRGFSIGLAVLSACSTGRDADVESLEPESLAKGFLFGGAKQVVAAMWDTDSAATSRFMTLFYSFLAQGRTSSDSLREAAYQIRRQRGWANPYYWASFSLFVQT